MINVEKLKFDMNDAMRILSEPYLKEEAPDLEKATLELSGYLLGIDRVVSNMPLDEDTFEEIMRYGMSIKQEWLNKVAAGTKK